MAHSSSEKSIAADNSPAAVIEKKKEFLIPCSYHFYSRPPLIVSGSLTRLRDSEGKEYTDFFSGVSVMACGHCNPAITEPVIEQIRTLQHTSSIYLTEPVVRLAERLAEILPGNLCRSFFCNSGSEANEGAMLLARLATGKRGFIALEGSLHGRTCLTSGATSIPMWRTDPFLGELPVRFARDAEEVCALLDRYGDDTAALILEPVQGNAGIRLIPKNFFDTVSPALKKNGALLIADEVQTGFGRTGKMFAIEHWGITPDILTGAKALGNGFPIGFYSTTNELASHFTKPSASTLGGNPVSCTAGIAVLDYIEKENLVERAASRGALLTKRLTEIASITGEAFPGSNLLSPPRGLGLMLGMEVGNWKGQTASELTNLILERMKDSGFFLGKNGLARNVLAFQPPLIISEKEIEDMSCALANIVREIIA